MNGASPEGHHLFGTGLGFVDAHLLASARLTDGSKVWTRDRALKKAAGALDLSYNA